jgi:archaellum component FlaC
MEAMRTRWSDERLDDLKEGVDDGFKDIKESIVRLDGRIHQLQHAMILAVVAICTMMFAGFGALITLFAIHF